MKVEQSVQVVWKRDKTMSVVTQRNYKINYKTQKTMPQTKFSWILILIQYRSMLKEEIKPGEKHNITQNHEYFVAYIQQHFEMSEIYIILAS